MLVKGPATLIVALGMLVVVPATLVVVLATLIKGLATLIVVLAMLVKGLATLVEVLVTLVGMLGMPVRGSGGVGWRSWARTSVPFARTRSTKLSTAPADQRFLSPLTDRMDTGEGPGSRGWARAAWGGRERPVITDPEA
jgi:hypothetical protein